MTNSGSKENAISFSFKSLKLLHTIPLRMTSRSGHADVGAVHDALTLNIIVPHAPSFAVFVTRFELLLQGYAHRKGEPAGSVFGHG